jgi:hypothetical protein
VIAGLRAANGRLRELLAERDVQLAEKDTRIAVLEAIYFHRALSYAGSGPSWSSTRARDTGWWSATTSSACSGARAWLGRWLS